MSLVGVSGTRRLKDAALLLLLFVFLIPVMKAWSTLAGYWGKFSETYAHGYLVLACAIYLLYDHHQRSRIFSFAASRPETLLAVLASAGLGTVFVIADFIQVRIVMLALMPALLLVWIFGVFGARAARAAIIPCGLLYTAIPLWEVLSVPLRVMAVAVTEYGLELIDIPAYIDGFKIELTNGILEVAHGCSGLVYLLTSVALSVIISALHFGSVAHRVLVIAAACLVGITTNWIRIYSLVLIAHYSKMQSSLVTDHELYGWVVYLVIFGAFMYWVLRVSNNASIPQDSAPELCQKGSRSSFEAALLLCMSLIITTVSVSHLVNASKGVGATVEFNLLGFRKINPDEVPVRYSGFDSHFAWRGVLSGYAVRTDILIYTQQKQGKELAYYMNHIALPEEKITRAIDSGGFSLNQLYGGSRGRLIAWQYRVGTSSTTHPLALKLLEAWYGLSGNLVSGLHTVIYLCADRHCSDDEWLGFQKLDITVLADSLEITTAEAKE